MKTKIFTLLFAIVASIGLMNAETHTGSCGDNLTWTVDTETGELVISGTGDMEDFDWICSYTYDPAWKMTIVRCNSTVPWQSYIRFIKSIVISDNVKTIGNHAFSRCDSLTSIIIPNTITSIGDSAFASCSRLFSITIPNSVTSIGSRAFEGCYGLKEVHISDISKWCSINFGDVYSNPLRNAKNLYVNGSLVTDLVIPDGVTSIGNFAFIGCSSLTSITIPNSVTSIGNFTFSDCSGLTSINIPNSVTSIGNRAFYNCSSLTSITIPNSVTSIGNITFYNCSSLTSITIPNSVTSIGNYLFYNCIGLTSVTIGNGVTSIGDEAFYGCSSLTSVTIPSSVTSIGEHAFYGCKINKIDFIGTIKEWCNKPWSPFCFRNNKEVSYSLYINGAIIMDLVVPNSVTSIDENSFYGCSSLTSVNIPESVTIIGKYAFHDCSNLTDATICMTNIHKLAFFQCRSLTSVTIANSVKRIEHWAFYDTQLNTLIVQSTTPPEIEEQAIPWYSDLKIFIPCHSLKEYQEADYWYLLSHDGYTGYRRLIENGFTLTSVIDEEEYSKILLCDGEEIVFPTKEGHTFIPSEEIPELMPEHDLTITGTFAVNSYDIVYVIDNEEYQRISVPYSTKLTAIAPPAREGYTFSGWSKLPATMPANDVTISGSFTANQYALIYVLDGEEYYRTNIVYGTPLTAIEEPAARKGYTFSGWSGLPATMPANDVTITGLFTANQYALIYVLDSEEYYRTNIVYGTPLTPIAEPAARKGYTFSGWSELPVTMPANDVTIAGSFIINQYTITIIVNDTKSGYITGEGRYDYGKTVILTATPADGYRFVCWSDDNTDNPRTIILTEDMTLTAYFERIPDALDDVYETDRTPSATKVFENGQIYILLPDGRHYNLQGMEVK